MPDFVNHLLPFCYLAFTIYLIWSELKAYKAVGPKKDALIDFAITIILVAISIYQLFVYKCSLTNYLTYIYLLTVLSSFVYGTIVALRYNEREKEVKVKKIKK